MALPCLILCVITMHKTPKQKNGLDNRKEEKKDTKEREKQWQSEH